ncbi:unnamed protein product [Phytophthora fragariaefolia]|uniref:Unnamed protein product n=1 Tax=Phytophthora fragariaefolia TaxID=1490495 RepID=A0A9W6XX65_9STRA|nr:unnamed protein product [Phytophthora fragariaefolia]
MQQATDEQSTDGAQAPSPAPPATSRARTGMVEDSKELSTADVRETDVGTTAGANAPATGDNASELMALLRGLAGKLERLEESQGKLEKKLDERKARRADANQPSTPPMDSS